MIVYALDAIQNPVSLFEPVYSEGGDTLYVMDQISDKKNKEDHWLENLSLREAMNRLGERERHIIDMRFYEGKTQMEVAEEIGISQAQVSRLEKTALKTMKNYLALHTRALIFGAIKIASAIFTRSPGIKGITPAHNAAIMSIFAS